MALGGARWVDNLGALGTQELVGAAERGCLEVLAAR